MTPSLHALAPRIAAVLGWALLACGIATTPARAGSYHYEAMPNNGFLLFEAVGINNLGQAVGSYYDDDANYAGAAIYQNGSVHSIGGSQGIAINNLGQAVGVVDQNQAALFSGGTTTPLGLPGAATYSAATSISDDGRIVGYSYNSDTGTALTVFAGGAATNIALGQGLSSYIPYLSHPDVNDAGQVAGIGTLADGSNRGYRYDLATGATTVLNPLAGDHDSWALGINSKGEVLGYSFNFNGDEHIGVWDKNGNFTTYFTEGTAQYPTLSSSLYFNNLDQILITDTTDAHSYLITSPGVRVDLGSLVADAPPGVDFSTLTGINDKGQIIGVDYNNLNSYLLSPVPEPASLAMLGVGAAMVIAYGRRRCTRRTAA